MTRRALCLSAAGAAGLDPLKFADGLAAEFADALRGFGFSCAMPAPATAAELGDAVYAEIEACGPDDVLVVAVIGHGEMSTAGDLHVVGRDGVTARQTRVVDWVKEVENRPDGPRTLFFVDVCNAGASTRSPHQLLLPSPARATVFAACAPDLPAFEGLFTQAATRVLSEMGRGLRNIPAASEFVSLVTLHADIHDQMEKLVRELDLDPQQMMSSLVEFRTAADVPAFFANPDYDPAKAAAVEQIADPALGGFLAEIAALDPRQYVVRQQRSWQAGCFTGRDAELAALSPWLDGIAPGDLRVVVGSRGTGKSALLGMLACAAHPGLRARTQSIWTRAAHRPGKNDLLAVAHARQRSSGEIFAVLAAQLGLEPQEEGWTRESFRAALRETPTLLIDALDEAVDGAELAADLHALVESGACRLLVGLRPEPPFDQLRRTAEAAGGLVDLDGEDRGQVREDVRTYVEAVLELTDPYTSSAYAAVRTAFAGAVAETLSAEPVAGERWGEFLMAGMSTQLFAARPEPVTDPGLARELGLAAPRTLPEVMRLELAGRPKLAAVLTALSHARGDGMPVEIVRALAPLFGEPMTAAEVRAVLAEAKPYLRESFEEDGTTVLYRLFHQSLADHLRSGDILDRLLPERWEDAPAYVLRHALHHAGDAGRTAELLALPGFLVHADPAATLAYLASLPEAPIGAHVYRASAARHAEATPDERRQVLAVDAARFGEHRLARELMRDAAWSPAWATGVTVNAALRMTIPVGGAQHALATLSLGDRPVLAISSDEGPVRMWDLRTGMRTGSPFGLGREVTALSDWPEGRALATGHADGSIRLWDPDSGRQLASWETGHAGRVNALAAHGAYLVSTGADGRCVRWTADGQALLLAEGLGEVNSACCSTVNGPVAVTVDHAGTATLWPLRGGTSLGKLHRNQERFLAAAPSGASAVTLLAERGRLWSWDLLTDLAEVTASTHTRYSALSAGAAGDTAGMLTCPSLGTVAAHTGPVTALAHVVIEGEPVIVSAGRDGRVRLWNEVGAAASAPARRTPITSLAVCTGAVAAVADGAMHLYDPRTGEPTSSHEVPPGARATGLPGRDRLLTYATDGQIVTWAPGAGRLPEPTELTTTPQIVVAGRLGQRDVLVCGSASSGVVELAEVETGRLIATHKIGPSPISDLDLYVMGNRSCLIAVDAMGLTWIIDLVSGHPVAQRLPGARGTLAARGARVHGRHVVVTAGKDGVLRGWDLRDPALSGQGSVRHARPITSLACARIGERPIAITGSLDATLSFWDLRTWQRTDTFALPEPAEHLAVTEDGGVAIAMRAELVMLR
ncbi:hypothetical protein ACIBG8_26410 [Nonomuraea sp. NPDC050556]|uniref:hypothetical protein n=1 Tax=Nonomuraea sp. NPDC050556 TaxID=3364369 RepID=UPI0037B61ACC